jgi:sulfite exporter TauE/SafE
MFARFNFISPDSSSKNIIGILSIGMGTVVWWLFISSMVDKLRCKFNPRGLKIFNAILGVILIIIGIVGLVSGAYSLIEMV